MFNRCYLPLLSLSLLITATTLSAIGKDRSYFQKAKLFYEPTPQEEITPQVQQPEVYSKSNKRATAVSIQPKRVSDWFRPKSRAKVDERDMGGFIAKKWQFREKQSPGMQPKKSFLEKISFRPKPAHKQATPMYPTKSANFLTKNNANKKLIVTEPKNKRSIRKKIISQKDLSSSRKFNSITKTNFEETPEGVPVVTMESLAKLARSSRQSGKPPAARRLFGG